MLDYLIVGFGLSGAALASRLEKENRRFKVIDNGEFNSSKVAGGMMNPVILKRFTMAWNADEQLRTAISFYEEMEALLGERLLQPVELYRKFASVEEQNNWFEAADNKMLAPYLDTDLRSRINNAIPAEHGFGKVEGVRRLDTERYLEFFAEHLSQKGILETCEFDYTALEFEEDWVDYKGLKVQKVIFCEGFGIRKNSFFRYLPLTGNKGEYLIIHSPDLKLQATVKSSVFISPAGNDFYAVGATYNHSDKSPEPTPAAREDLEAKLRKLITVPYKVVDQVAGIRPSTVDRRPLVGRHPEIENFYCCNGFGSRGVIIAPTAADYLLDFIEKGEALPEQIDLSRFTRRWFGK